MRAWSTLEHGHPRSCNTKSVASLAVALREGLRHAQYCHPLVRFVPDQTAPSSSWASEVTRVAGTGRPRSCEGHFSYLSKSQPVQAP